ncbi:ACT domain-containing protein [Suillus paluster]|uniref:ACT domain-containing protein n=1 Tax=Suillus paluster TaxID=48578 RepID=UPI001B882978|nr:ACT domain-containing protein [Suillus paluster]KAG1754929.1 ACT domain-containing protein [Suillus paluster]
MPPPLNHPCLELELLDQTFFVKQLPVDAGVPVAIVSGLNAAQDNPSIFSITRTREEISIVGEAIGEDGEWKCIKIAGPMEFGMTGVICGFTTPLKNANVPVFAMSTWNTDYVLIPRGKVDEAVAALMEDGWKFRHISLKHA